MFIRYELSGRNGDSEPALFLLKPYYYIVSSDLTISQQCEQRNDANN